MAFGVAITLGVTGVMQLTSDDSAAPPPPGSNTSPSAPSSSVAPYASPYGAGAAQGILF